MALFANLVAQVNRDLNKVGAGGVQTTQAKFWVNRSLHTLRGEARWAPLRRKLTLSTVASQEEYRLPIEWGDIGLMWHEGFGYPFTLENISDHSFYGFGFDLDVTGTPKFYRLWGESGVEAQPSSASVITVVSSASSGDNTQTIRIQGIVGGVPDFENISLNNDTSVNGTKSFTRVDRISKSGSTKGRVTVTSNAAAVTVATFPAGGIYDSLSFFLMQLWPIPDAVLTLNAETYQRVYDLVDDNDVSPFGPEFDQAIVIYADYLGSLQATVTNPNASVTADGFYKAYLREVSRLRSLFERNEDRVFALQERGTPQASRSRGRDFLSFGPGFPRVFR